MLTESRFPCTVTAHITKQFQPHKETDHGQRTTAQEQGNKETKEETDSGNLSRSHTWPIAYDCHRPEVNTWMDSIGFQHNKTPTRLSASLKCFLHDAVRLSLAYTDEAFKL